MSRQDFPVGYVCVVAAIPDDPDIMAEQDMRSRLEDTRALSAQELGDRWIESRLTAVLKVQSAVVQGEHNYLLNPAHPDFPRITVDPPALFHFDPRLFL